MRFAHAMPHRAASPADSVAPVFTNILKESFLQELADADEGELIKQVQARRHQFARLHASASAVRSFAMRAGVLRRLLGAGRRARLAGAREQCRLLHAADVGGAGA